VYSWMSYGLEAALETDTFGAAATEAIALHATRWRCEKGCRCRRRSGAVVTTPTRTRALSPAYKESTSSHSLAERAVAAKPHEGAARPGHGQPQLGREDSGCGGLEAAMRGGATAESEKVAV
jgi:hypothetical protein